MSVPARVLRLKGAEVTTCDISSSVFVSSRQRARANLFPRVFIMETQTITGGTGRFLEASGTIIVERTVNRQTSAVVGSFNGTITRAH